MERKKSKNTFKKKLVNHLLKKGSKHIIEKITNKSIKQAQKHQKKNTNTVIKKSILNAIPTFRFIKLTNKNRRTKSLKQIPAFLSNNNFRSSWGLKNIINASIQKNEPLKKNLLTQLLSSSVYIQENLNTFNQTQQQEITKEKKYLKYYRW